MIEVILEYQKKDGQLLEIEKELASSTAKKVVNQMVGVVKNAQQKLVAMEKDSQTLISQFDQLLKSFEQESKTVESLKKEKLDNQTVEELSKCEKQIEDSTTKLLLLEKEINKLSKSISSSLKDFEKTKTELLEARTKHTKAMQAYNNLLDTKNVQVEKLKQELAKLEKQADKKFIKKYKEMREDKKFPVFVPLLGGHSCGGCLMELPISQLNKIDENGVLECENCHRIIYKMESLKK